VIVVVSCALLVAMFVARHSYMARQIREAEATDVRPPYSAGPEPVLQLPKIRVRSARDGIVVVLGNDSSDLRILLDPDKDRLVVEYESDSARAGPRLRVVALGARTLAPGETAEPVFIPGESRLEAVREVRFEHRDRYGVCRTSWTREN
jgi:hypothetical protein